MQFESSIPKFNFPFENLLRHSSIVFYQCSLDEDYPIIHISENARDILGYDPREFYEDPTFWIQQIIEDDRTEVEDSFQDIINQEKRTYVYRFEHGDGHEIWLRDENMVSYDDNDMPETITGTAIDITRQKQAEQEVKKLNATLEQRINKRTRNLSMANRKLKKQIQYRNKVKKQVSEQQRQLKLLQAGINHINDMVIISKATIDDPLNSEIVFTNNAFERFTGYTSEEVRGKTPTFLHGEKTSREKLAIVNEKMKQHETARIEMINYRKDGSTYWVDLEMSPFPADEEGMEYWVGINRNISKRKQAEQALEENEERYRAYTELSFDAIFELALDGTIIDCNARACQLFGYTKEELLGMNTRMLTPKEYIDSFPHKITSNITTGSNVLQREYLKKDGSTFTSEVNTKLYRRSDEDHVIAYVRDISEHIKYEEAIKKSLREKSTLLAEVHHRVKNNLAVISGLLEMQAFNAVDDQVISELRESQSRIQSIATVHEMLYQSESFSDIELEHYIDELVSYISGTLGSENIAININRDIDPISLTVKQAVPCGLLLNELLTNAYKHAFEDREKGTIWLNLHHEDTMVYLEVRDDGVGLPDDFEMEQSSSLGMTLVNTLVQQLEGLLAIETKPQTCFKIKFEIKE